MRNAIEGRCADRVVGGSKCTVKALTSIGFKNEPSPICWKGTKVDGFQLTLPLFRAEDSSIS